MLVYVNYLNPSKNKLEYGYLRLDRAYSEMVVYGKNLLLKTNEKKWWVIDISNGISAEKETTELFPEGNSHIGEDIKIYKNQIHSS